MSINNMNRWAVAMQSMDMKRSKWNQPFSHKTTFNSGFLIPLMCKEILPNDTFKVDVSAVIRSITPAVPVMDNSFIDFYFFFVPNRLCCANPTAWQKIAGENFSSYWAPSSKSSFYTEGEAFRLEEFGTTGSGGTNSGVQAGSLLNYLGVPVLTAAECNNVGGWINRMKLIGYGKIWNEWFRDENVQAPITDWDSFKLNASYGYLAGSGTNGSLMKVNKIFDYYTGCLPAPQKGSSVSLPLGNSAPVLTSSTAQATGSHNPLHWRYSSGSDLPTNGWSVTATTDGDAAVTPLTSSVGYSVYPDNLYADLSNATAATINQIRMAFALQRYLEKLARGGSRYRELLKVLFNTTIPDSTIQVPEYLAGFRQPLNITQVLQNSETSSSSPLGTTGAFSNTCFAKRGFVKSFVEHGFLYCVACVRTTQSYSQGLSKDWYRMQFEDFYQPTFANIGEQPVYASELYLKANGSMKNGSVFGYQEAWAEYRYSPTLVTGELAPDAGNTTLSVWTYTNKFTSSPVLNANFMYQPKSQIDDTLVVTNSSYQFIGDFYFPITTVRAMPLYSIPGLVDHH